MIFYLLIIIALILYGAKIDFRKEIGPEYISKDATTCINGIFTILIVASHYTNHLTFAWDPVLEGPYLAFRRYFQQLVVVSFLFYSGFGMESSIRKKGWPYIGTIPRRFFNLLYKFDVAVLLYLVLQISLGKEFSPKQILLSLIGWESVGNSNWYIFVILGLYTLMFLTYSLMKHMKCRADSFANTVAFLLSTILFIYFMMMMEKAPHFYNTAILMPIGVIYALKEEKIRGLLNKSVIIYLIVLALLIGIHLRLTQYRDISVVEYSMWAATFMLALVLVSMRLRVHNRILHFFGSHVFSIYIIQRIPMIILDYFDIISTHKYIGLIITYVVTIPLALLFERITDCTWKLFTKSGDKNGKQRSINA